MFAKKFNLAVGLTTYNTEMLGISIPALARLKQKFVLIIHNDNPDVKIKARQIRKMGYRGKLCIINSDFNVGLMNARCEIIKYVNANKIKTNWMTFVDDDDMLIDATIPSVDVNTFAVLQNMAVIRTRLIDVLRTSNTGKIITDDENIYLVRPHIGIAGTIVRFEYLKQWCDIICQNTDKISDINESVNFRLPVDLIMWSGVNIIATHTGTTPIYMDSINYVATDIDTATTKYGMPVISDKTAAKQYKKVITKYDTIVQDALNAAAPAGHN